MAEVEPGQGPARLSMTIVAMGVAGSGHPTVGMMLHGPNHFMKAGLLASQFDALDEPAGALVVDVSAPPNAIVEHVLSPVGTPDHASVARMPE